jgi:hypothetical protein
MTRVSCISIQKQVNNYNEERKKFKKKRILKSQWNFY